MPYINKQDRELIDHDADFTGMSGLSKFIKKLDKLRDTWPNTKSVGWHPGTLNYIITRLCHWWLGDNPNYAKYNELIGVLECAKMELYRRKVAPYEDKKIIENGDV